MHDRMWRGVLIRYNRNRKWEGDSGNGLACCFPCNKTYWNRERNADKRLNHNWQNLDRTREPLVGEWTNNPWYTQQNDIQCLKEMSCVQPWKDKIIFSVWYWVEKSNVKRLPIVWKIPIHGFLKQGKLRRQKKIRGFKRCLENHKTFQESQINFLWQYNSRYVQIFAQTYIEHTKARVNPNVTASFKYGDVLK